MGIWPIRLWARFFGRDEDDSLGRRGERAAARYLRRKGYRIVDHSCRMKVGELDLVALDGDTVVFVEVKTRAAGDVQAAAEAVGPAKQQRLIRTGLAYLKAHNLLEQRTRFDVVAIIWPENQRRPSIHHIPNAFEPEGMGQFFR